MFYCTVQSFTHCSLCQVPRLIDSSELRAELRRVLRLVQHKTKRPAAEPLDMYPANRRVSLLLKWAQAVATLHGLRVGDFRSSFGDGRALCYMVRDRGDKEGSPGS